MRVGNQNQMRPRLPNKKRPRLHPMRKQSKRMAGLASPLTSGRSAYFSGNQHYEILETGPRLRPDIETEKPDKLLDKREDHEIVAVTRDLRRNNSQIKGWTKQFLLHVIGTGQKPIFHCKDKKWKQQADRLIKIASKQWEAKTGRHRIECDRDVLKTCIVEGEILIFFDHSGIINEGRFVYIPRDRMPEIRDFKEQQAEIAKIFDVKPRTVKGETVYDIHQNKGVIENHHGVVLGYVVGPQVGDEDANLEDVTLIPLNVYKAKLITIDAEVGGTHGHSDLLSNADDVQDVTKLRKSQVKKAEMQAKFGLAFKVKDSKIKSVGRSQSDGLPGDTINVMKRSRNAADPGRKLHNMEKLGANGGPAIEYLEPEESIEAISMDKGDAVEVDTTSSNISKIAAFAMGLPRLYATGDASHGVFASLMAENSLAQSLFSYLQKWLERELYDFQIEAIIDYYIKKNILADVDYEVNWSNFPVIKSLNPLQAIKAKKEGWKSGVEIPDITDLDVHIESLKEIRQAFVESEVPSDVYNAELDRLVPVSSSDSNSASEPGQLRKLFNFIMRIFK